MAFFTSWRFTCNCDGLLSLKVGHTDGCLMIADGQVPPPLGHNDSIRDQGWEDREGGEAKSLLRGVWLCEAVPTLPSETTHGLRSDGQQMAARWCAEDLCLHL